ncbi:MAG: hypothetical protein WBL88_00875 [Nitrososphaeraceae archaeon]
MVTSARLLDDAYRTEKDDDVDVRERLLLVRRVLVDNEEETASAAEKEFHRSR